MITVRIITFIGFHLNRGLHLEFMKIWIRFSCCMLRTFEIMPFTGREVIDG